MKKIAIISLYLLLLSIVGYLLWHTALFSTFPIPQGMRNVISAVDHVIENNKGGTYFITRAFSLKEGDELIIDNVSFKKNGSYILGLAFTGKVVPVEEKYDSEIVVDVFHRRELVETRLIKSVLYTSYVDGTIDWIKEFVLDKFMVPVANKYRNDLTFRVKVVTPGKIGKLSPDVVSFFIASCPIDY